VCDGGQVNSIIHFSRLAKSKNAWVAVRPPLMDSHRGASWTCTLSHPHHLRLVEGALWLSLTPGKMKERGTSRTGWLSGVLVLCQLVSDHPRWEREWRDTQLCEIFGGLSVPTCTKSMACLPMFCSPGDLDSFLLGWQSPIEQCDPLRWPQVVRKADFRAGERNRD
jgi:hypothetical protein